MIYQCDPAILYSRKRSLIIEVRNHKHFYLWSEVLSLIFTCLLSILILLSLYAKFDHEVSSFWYLFEPVNRQTKNKILKVRMYDKKTFGNFLKKTVGRRKRTEEAVCPQGMNQGDNNKHSTQTSRFREVVQEIPTKT